MKILLFLKNTSIFVTFIDLMPLSRKLEGLDPMKA